MSGIAERLKYYDTKCRQHLKRVRLSHLLALETLQSETFVSNEKYKSLIDEPVGSVSQEEYVAKVRSVLNKLHLVSLKSNFELFLNRLLSTVWAFHFAELAPAISNDVSLSNLSAWFVEAGVSSANAREFLIDKIVPRHGLTRFEKLLGNGTDISLRDVLYAENIHYWPQIFTAFEVRHLVEHRDGQIDNQFRANVRRFWSQSSWGSRLTLERLERVVVDEEDVLETYTAMLVGAELLTNEVLRWSLGKAS